MFGQDQKNKTKQNPSVFPFTIEAYHKDKDKRKHECSPLCKCRREGCQKEDAMTKWPMSLRL